MTVYQATRRVLHMIRQANPSRRPVHTAHITGPAALLEQARLAEHDIAATCRIRHIIWEPR